MSDNDGKSKVTKFKKRDHRPWKRTLLESTIQEADAASGGTESLDFNLGSEQTSESISKALFADFDFTKQQDAPLPELSPSLQSTFSQLQAIAATAEPNDALKTAIKNSADKKAELLQQISDKSNSSVLLGGFFQPQQLNASDETQGVRKMNFLLSDLKNKEQELNLLTNKLKETEAIEQAEQAELNRRAEEQRRIAAENRMREAIEQAHGAAKQCRLAMEQANQAAIAHREEEQLRRLAEDQINDLKIRLNTLELALQNERNAKLAAEHAAQQALRQTEETTQTALRQTEEANLLAKRQSIEMSQKITQLTNQNEELQSKVSEIERNYKETSASLIYNQQKLQELTAQRDKLKNIIEAEQELRRVAERRAQEALTRAEEAEKARDAEEQQRKMIDARAKRAVEHASRTVMHLLNAPVDNEYSMRIPNEQQATAPKEKMKIKVLAETTQKEYIPSEDDYNF